MMGSFHRTAMQRTDQLATSSATRLTAQPMVSSHHGIPELTGAQQVHYIKKARESGKLMTPCFFKYLLGIHT